MDIRELRCMIAVAEAGTYSKAAEELFVSRQAVAKTIRHVEAQSGRRLFERDANRLVPTKAGLQTVEDARDLVERFDRLCDVHFPLLGNEGASGRGGAVASGAMPAVRERVSLALVTGGSIGLPKDFLEGLMASDPWLTPCIEEMSSDSVLTAVANGEAEIGILGSHPSLLEGYELLMLRSSGVWILLPRGHELGGRAYLELADLDGLAMVTAGPHNHLHRWVMGRCASEGIRPNLLAQVTEGRMFVQMVHDKGAACFGFSPQMAPTPEGCIVLELDMPGARDFATYAIRCRGASTTPAAERFWDYMRRHAGDSSL